MAQIVGGQNAGSIHVKRSDPDIDKPKRIIKTLRFELASQNASGFRILLHSIVYEWIFSTRVLSTQPKMLSNTKE